MITSKGDLNGVPWPPMFSTLIQDGDLLYHRTAGGGGCGDPFDREPEAVAQDVLDEKISKSSARENYGVVLDGEGAVDQKQTAQLRARTCGRRSGRTVERIGNR
jgi:N-methylhydantoinase B/oxoprolinase/acetone carboxylase alpha subunit